MAGHDWQLYTVGDFLKLTLPQAAWVITDLARAGGMVLLSAPAKVGKTTLALQAAAAIRHAHPFLGRAVPQMRRVLVLQADNPESDWHGHLTVLAPAVPGLGSVDFVLCEPHWLGQPTQVALVKQHLHKAKPDYLIVDALETTASVTANLNERAGMQQSLAALHKVWAGPVLVLHHLRKPPAGGDDVGWASPAGHHSLSAMASVLWLLSGNAKRATLHVQGRGIKPSSTPLVRVDPGVWVVASKGAPPSTSGTNGPAAGAPDDLYQWPAP